MKAKIGFLLLILFLSMPLQAQQDLRIGAYFNGQFRHRKDATEVLMKGHKLAPYKLSLFRSLTIGTANVNLEKLEQTVQADGATAIDKDVGYARKHLYYAFYQLKPRSGKRRYLFYRNNSLNPHNAKPATLTLIYMEGTATLDELKRNFGK